ncbi:EAL domain-containing protein [Caballeronia grimmiae]|uniref:EAL domain-containing protein n=1 Tax=Caballeronia grimmiae TaxID=1071679 RepID=UPI0038B928A9
MEAPKTALMAFVARLQDDAATRSIQRNDPMARSLGMSVTAEGVEDAAQLEFLHEASCDSFQGFLLNRPVSPEDVLGLLDTALSLGRRALLAPSAYDNR